jgi:superfamily II DNA or RNA helicase
MITQQLKLFKMDTNDLRDQQQRKALNNWAINGFEGSIIAGTGFGKSRCGVIAVGETIKRLTEYNDYGERIVYITGLILVPTTQLKDQFREEFIKWGYENVLDTVDIMCYQSAYKMTGRHYDIVVCDEIHLGLSKEYRKFFDNNVFDRLLCMTATLPEEFEYKELLVEMAPIVYEITLDECVDLGLVSPYNIICKPLELTYNERTKYKKINNRFVYWKGQLGNFDAWENASYILKNISASPEEKKAAIQFYKAIRERKKIIDFAENKIETFKDIVLNNPNKRILAFSGANEFTDILTDSVIPLAQAYHSKKTKKQRKRALEHFKSGMINVLCSTKALNQGFDVPDANMGIVCGLTSKSLPMIQRVGRLIRFQEDKTGEIIILYIKDSQEEKWLKNAVKNLNNVKFEES